MDFFGDDNLFDVFNGETTDKPQVKRQLDQSTIDRVHKKFQAMSSLQKKTPSDDTVVSLADSKLSSSSSPDTTQQPLNIITTSGSEKKQLEFDDMFKGYQPQVVTGSDKPTEQIDPTRKTCAMQTCYPPQFDVKAYEAMEPPQREPAKKYPFVLDPFQAESIKCIEKNQSVLVSAHTSAGKTVVAEYAIALSLKLGQRVIYTSPIKALSNQKYRELQEEFTDVGLLTGDITINPTASCLVMTTEILRNMLYRGSEVLREVAWVVFDEIHYMRDRSRGVVWEETIILLPHKSRFVFLSATIPNATEFALWVAKLHNQPCSVVYTNYRPTPLEHHVFPQNGEGYHLILDRQGQFRENNFQKAMASLNMDAAGIDSGEGTKKKSKRSDAEDDVEGLVKKVKDLGLDPCIVFSFSKKDCERYARRMTKIDFCTDEERQLINTIYNNAIDALNDDDKKLPQVQEMIPLLRKGIGVHHGGLLPILKEVIEILFQEGLLRVLFSTETFAMGLNMPARTVIFTSMFKFDGVTYRPLTSGEYIQMSGRAGRRGLDDKGVVILMLDQQVEATVVKEMVTGAADPLLSSFHLGYNMLLNLLRLEEASPEYLIARSFYQFQQQRAIPQITNVIQAVKSQRETILREIATIPSVYYDMYKSISQQGNSKANNNQLVLTRDDTVIPWDIAIRQYYALYTNIILYRYQLRKLLTLNGFYTPFIQQSGRLVQVRGIIRQGPPPMAGSASALALKQSYNDPISVGAGLLQLELNPELTEILSELRNSQHILLGTNLNTPNSISTSQVVGKKGPIEGVNPPGFDVLSQLDLSDPAHVRYMEQYNMEQEMDWGWGIIVSCNKKAVPASVIHGASTPLPPVVAQSARRNQRSGDDDKDRSITALVVDVLIPADPDTVPKGYSELSTTGHNYEPLYATHQFLRPCPANKTPQYVIVPIVVSAINAVGTSVLKSVAVKTSQQRSESGTRLATALHRLNTASGSIQAYHNDSMIEILTPDDLNIGEVAEKARAALTSTSAKSQKKLPQMPTKLIDNIIETRDKLKRFHHQYTQHPLYKYHQLPPKSSSDEDEDDDEQNTKKSKKSKKSKSKTSTALTNASSSTLLVNHADHPLATQALSLYAHKLRLDGYLIWFESKLRDVSRDANLAQTLAAMKRVLRNLDLVNQDDIILPKGRVACELSTCDELVGTELLFGGVFNDLTISQVCALASCMVFDDPLQDDAQPELPDDLATPHHKIQDISRAVGTIVQSNKIPLDVDKFVRSFNPFLMNVVAKWCTGAKFAEVCKETDVFEGTIIRVMRRLEELLRQFATAAQSVGNTDLETKFNDCITRIKRDIVFAASLYL